MSGRLVYFNGEFIPESEARISIFDCALMHGDMLFERTRSFNQKPYRLREHLERLYASMKYARINRLHDNRLHRTVFLESIH